MTDTRLAALRQALHDLHVDGLLVMSPLNRRYLCGFTGSAGALVVGGRRHAIVADFRYWEMIERQVPEWELVKVQRALHVPGAVARVAKELGIARLGFEGEHVSVATWEALVAESDGVAYECVSGVVERMRTIKDADELSSIRRAAEITDSVYANMRAWVRPGLTEREVAWGIERRLREGGADGLAFPVIVGSGPNGAMPHGRPTDRALETGEPVIVDFGANVNGYLSDLTRTFCLGTAPDRLRELHALVVRAQHAALECLRAGVSGKAVDSAARDVIAAGGYGDQFGHSLGHSLGLAEHEEPGLSPQNDLPLPAGVIETVEPGIYIPGWGGVRHEDLVLVREGGPELLSRADLALEWSTS